MPRSTSTRLTSTATPVTRRAPAAATGSSARAALRLVEPAIAPPAPDAARVPVEPILKWAGGKTRLLPELVGRIPAPVLAALTASAAASRSRARTSAAGAVRAASYFEPFAGGAAMFFHLRPARATLTDTNPELINLYSVIRDEVEALIETLSDHPHDRAHFYAVRSLDPATLPPVERAARMMFLNRTCFNGLWRVNKKGQFNVPFGSYVNPTICPADRLRAASTALAGVSLQLGDFERATATARAGDFVYFDPPYVPLTRTASFTAYTGVGFDQDDQARLAAHFTRLAERGVHCMLSNSDTPLVRELFAGHRVDRVLAPRSISRDATRRDAVAEVIVTSHPY